MYINHYLLLSERCVCVRSFERKTPSVRVMSEWRTNEVIVWWQAIENLNISPGKWACPNIWFEWRVSISTYVRSTYSMSGPNQIDGYEMNALLTIFSSRVFFSPFFLCARENLIFEIYTVYRCVTGQRSNEDNTSSIKITQKKKREKYVCICEIGILHRISIVVSCQYSTATQFLKIEPTLRH